MASPMPGGMCTVIQGACDEAAGWLGTALEGEHEYVMAGADRDDIVEAVTKAAKFVICDPLSRTKGDHLDTVRWIGKEVSWRPVEFVRVLWIEDALESRPGKHWRGFGLDKWQPEADVWGRAVLSADSPPIVPTSGLRSIVVAHEHRLADLLLGVARFGPAITIEPGGCEVAGIVTRVERQLRTTRRGVVHAPSPLSEQILDALAKVTEEGRVPWTAIDVMA